MPRPSLSFLLPLCAASLAAQTSPPPQLHVVPSTYTATDAVSYQWIAGASQDVRQQTLIGSSHLASAIGRDIWAIELRRTAANETYQGGVANLTVRLSTSPSLPLSCSDAFAANTGPDVVVVFQGQVTLPTSPPALGPTVAWTPDNVVRVQFQQPFRYQGGTLCIDVTGLRQQGQTADWWMADAEFEDLSGTEVEIGTGCGMYGGPQGRWSDVSPRTLLPGAHASFWAYGAPNGFAFAVFGEPSAIPIPLGWFGLNAPGCNCHLLPSSIAATILVPFVPEVHPLLMARGGRADVRLRIPALPAMMGARLTTQWFDLQQPATSNAITWTVAQAIPTLDMALIEGHPSEPTGEVTVHLAHVLRLESR